MAHGQEIVFFAPPQYRGLQQSDTKSVFRKVLDTLSLGGSEKVERYSEHQFGRRRVASFLEGVREYSEASFTGGALGMLDGAGHIEPAGIPVDLTVGVLGFATKVIAGADSGLGKTAGDMGAAGTAVYWFRQGRKMTGNKSSHHGDFDPDNGSSNVEDDPVVQAAEAAGL